jgi:hypothetical protein
VARTSPGRIFALLLAILAAGLFFRFAVLGLLLQPVRIYDLRHSDGAHEISLVLDRQTTHCGAKFCTYPTAGHYVTSSGTVSNVRAYPAPDHQSTGSIEAITSPEHPHIAVPTDAYGYLDGGIGLFELSVTGSLVWVAFRLAIPKNTKEGPNAES